MTTHPRVGGRHHRRLAQRGARRRRRRRRARPRTSAPVSVCSARWPACTSRTPSPGAGPGDAHRQAPVARRPRTAFVAQAHGLLRPGGQLLPVARRRRSTSGSRAATTPTSPTTARRSSSCSRRSPAPAPSTRSSGATRADAEPVIDQAVALHAAFWDNDALRGLDWLPPINTPLNLVAGDLAEQKLPAYLEYWKGTAARRGRSRSSSTLTPHYPALLDWWVDQGHADARPHRLPGRQLPLRRLGRRRRRDAPRLAAEHAGRRRVGHRQLPRRRR